MSDNMLLRMMALKTNLKLHRLSIRDVIVLILNKHLIWYTKLTRENSAKNRAKTCL